MSETFRQIIRLMELSEVRISDHAYDEMAADGLYVTDVTESVADAVVIEDYPDYPKAPCVLTLQKDRAGQSIHVVWGIPRDKSTPVVLVTAYRPIRDAGSRVSEGERNESEALYEDRA